MSESSHTPRSVVDRQFYQQYSASHQATFAVVFHDAACIRGWHAHAPCRQRQGGQACNALLVCVCRGLLAGTVHQTRLPALCMHLPGLLCPALTPSFCAAGSRDHPALPDAVLDGGHHLLHHPQRRRDLGVHLLPELRPVPGPLPVSTRDTSCSAQLCVLACGWQSLMPSHAPLLFPAGTLMPWAQSASCSRHACS